MKAYLLILFLCTEILGNSIISEDAKMDYKLTILTAPPKIRIEKLQTDIEKGNSQLSNDEIVSIISQTAIEQNGKQIIIDEILNNNSIDKFKVLDVIIVDNFEKVELTFDKRKQLLLDLFENQKLNIIIRKKALSKLANDKNFNDPIVFKSLLIDKKYNSRMDMDCIINAWLNYKNIRNNYNEESTGWLDEFISAESNNYNFSNKTYLLYRLFPYSLAMPKLKKALLNEVPKIIDKRYFNKDDNSNLTIFSISEAILSYYKNYLEFINDKQCNDDIVNLYIKLSETGYSDNLLNCYLARDLDDQKQYITFYKKCLEDVNVDKILLLKLAFCSSNILKEYCSKEILDLVQLIFKTNTDSNIRLLAYKIISKYTNNPYDKFQLTHQFAKSETDTICVNYLKMNLASSLEQSDDCSYIINVINK